MRFLWGQVSLEGALLVQTNASTASRALFVFLTLALSSGMPQMAMSETAVNLPAKVIHRIELRELWRTGANDSEVIFGVVGNPLVTDDGGIAVLDYQQNAVLVLSRYGKLMKEIDLSGEGPGSVGYPSCLVRLEDGRFALAQGYPASIEIFNADWQYDQSIQLFKNVGNDELRLENIMAYRGGFIIIGENIQKERTRSTFLFRRNNYVNILSASGELVGPVYSRKRVVDFSNYNYVEDEIHDVQKVAVGAAGEIFIITKRNGYEITVFDSDGNRQTTLTRDYKSLTRTKEKIKFLETFRQTIFERSIKRYTIEISKYEPDLFWLEYTYPGELRVTTSRSYKCSDPDVYCRYDIFDLKGNFVRQDDIILPTNENPGGQLHWLEDGRLMLITGLDDAINSMTMASENAQNALEELGDEMSIDPMEIVLYEIGKTIEQEHDTQN